MISVLMLACGGDAGSDLNHAAVAIGGQPRQPKDHAELWQRATELKRGLTALLQKLNPDR
jgi:hypothetical protein